MVAPFEEAGDF